MGGMGVEKDGDVVILNADQSAPYRTVGTESLL